MPKRLSSPADEMVRYNIWLNGQITHPPKIRVNPKKTYWIQDFWKISTKSLSRPRLMLITMLLVFTMVTVHARGDPNSSPTDYDLNGKRVTYYPESLMISRNPHAVVFYKDTKLFNLLVDLRAPDIGHDFTINNTCDKDTSQFLTQLLDQIRTSQKTMQRLLSMHSYTSLIEYDSYLRRYYQYSTGFSPTITCPYAYKKSLSDCKQWALKQCASIGAKERQWLLEPQQDRKRGSRQRRSTPWACSAGVLGIPRFFYTKILGKSCEKNNVFGLVQTFSTALKALQTTGYLIRTVNGKTVYLAKVTDRLVTKVNQLQSALRQIDSTFSNWQTKLKLFATHENCHFNNFLEFLSKFSLEVTRTFSQQLRFTEIKILHQSHKLHNKQLVGVTDLPSFLATALHHRLDTIPSLQETATALVTGYSLLIQPFIDYQYHMGKSVGINFLFTIPELSSKNSFCTVEYLTPIKYNISGICFHGPVTRDELALLRCQHNEYISHRSILNKCYQTDETFVCPQHILQMVNDTNWLGIPWYRDTQFNFIRRHQKAPDCSNMYELFHLGGRYYLSTQHGSINVHNTTNGSSHILHISTLTVYHFPCDLTFASQQTGLGTCPDRITFHLPLFSHKSFHNIPWTHNDDSTLRLHYNSLNLTPSLQFDNKTMTSLDHTFRLLDGQLSNSISTA